MKKTKKIAKGSMVCLLTVILMALITSNAAASLTVTDSVTVDGDTATFDINITGATNLSDVKLIYGTTATNYTWVHNWTGLSGTTFNNDTQNATDLPDGTYYYEIYIQDNGTWDNTTEGTFIIGSSGLALLSLSSSQATEVGIILTYGLIFGLWLLICLFLLAQTKAKKFGKRKPMIDMSNGQWLGISLILAFVLTFATWYLFNVYLATDWLSTLEGWFSSIF